MDFYLHTHPRMKELHLIERDLLDEALLEFEGAALKFSYDAIKDAEQRANYERNTKRVKELVKQQLELGKVTAKSAAEFCYTLRNHLLAETRKVTSVQGRSVVEWRKKVPPELERLLNNNAVSKYGKKFVELSSKQRDAIYYMIVESSARSSVFFNVLNKALMVAGKVFIVVTLAYAIYEIMSSDDKFKETIKQSVTIGLGVVGVILGKALASSVCGPGTPICAVGIVAASGVGLGTVAGLVIDSMDEEIDEYLEYWILS